MTERVALITGITGQDGAYLAELLLDKGYVVHGIKRRSSSFNTGRVEHLYQDPHEKNLRFIMHYGDMTDATNLIRIVQETQPDEIYNLAAQSHVQVLFETPEYTANADALGTLRLLEAIRILGLDEDACASIRPPPPSCTARFRRRRKARQRPSIRARPTRPRSSMPIGSRSITARPMACMPRTAFCSITKGPTRGETFVTRKITRAVAAIMLGKQDKLYLGNLDAERDWGHARDYVEGMWLMLQQAEARRLRAGDGRNAIPCANSSKRPLPASAARIEWRGKGRDEVGRRSRQRSCAGRDRSALFPPDRSGATARRSDQGTPEARLAPSCEFPDSC